MPTGKGLGDAVRRGKAIGCTAIQVFTSSPQQWKGRRPDPSKVADFKRALSETGIEKVVSHDSYLINVASPDPELRNKSKLAILEEMTRCADYGIGYTVSHVGAHQGEGDAKGLLQAAESLREVLPSAPEGVVLLMETTAGQGSSLNWQFEHLAWLLEELKEPKNLGVCLDTCHIFAAGYDIRTAEGFQETFERFEKLIGFKHLHAVHCNDSKKAFGSRVDRHDHLGEGLIGPVAFQCLVKDPRFENIPILIETPEADTHHAVNVERLWNWQK